MSQTGMTLYEPESGADAPENSGHALTLGNLLLLTSFLITIMAVIMPLQHAGKGVVRYVLGVPSALALGALIVWLNWNFQKLLLQQSKGATKKKDNVIAAIFLLSLLFFIAVGDIAGNFLALLLLKLLA